MAATYPISSATTNPITKSKLWQYITVSGTKSPGVIAVGGIKGFERKTGWDIKKGKGTQGATLTLATLPPAEGEIEFLLWLPQHFSQWTSFRTLLKYNTTKNQNSSGAAAFNIYHPALRDLDISQVVVSEISPVDHKGKGLYSVTVKFIEWHDPPPVSVVQTTKLKKDDTGDGPGPGTGDAFGDGQEAQISGLVVVAVNKTRQILPGVFEP